MSDPWLKFYPADWRSDPALRLCSRAARGTWIDMLSIMHEAEPYGELRINGIPLDIRGLAKVLGEDIEGITADLSELEANGVFSRRKNGVIYSRRMEKDENLRRKNRENGKKGGNPSLRKEREIGASLIREDKANMPDARSQIPEEEKKEHSSSVPKKPTPRSELKTVLDDERADALLEHRQRIRKPMTVRAASLLAAKLARTGNPNAAADLMIERGWQGFEPKWLEDQGLELPRMNGSATGPPAPPDPSMPSDDELRKRYGTKDLLQ